MGSVERCNRNERIPLSFAQQRLWFLDQLQPGSAAYNVPFGIRVQGRLDVDALSLSLKQIVERHEALRTSFPTDKGVAWQRIHETFEPPLVFTDLSALPEWRREERLREIMSEQASLPFDLTNTPPIRLTLLRLTENDHALVAVMSHIICDGWSIPIIARELTELYKASVEGKQSPLPPVGVQYADFAVWQRKWLQGAVLDQQVSYWRKQLGGVEPLALQPDFPRATSLNYRGAALDFELDASLVTGLKELCRQEQVTLFMTLFAAFQVLMSRYTGQRDITIGSPIAGRKQLKTEGLIGMFVNVLALRANLESNPSFRELLAQVRRTVLDAYAYQDVPFEKLMEELQPERDMSRPSIVQVLLALQNLPQESLRLGELRVSRFRPAGEIPAKYEISLSIAESETGMRGTFEYAADLFSPTTMQRLLSHWQRLLEGIIADIDRPALEIDLLAPAETRQILHEWNDTAREYPREKCVHELFEEQVERTPEAVAIGYEGLLLTYEELNRRANRLAHYLRISGVGPESLVGICIERSPEMVVGILGILKAGGTYVPLDPNYPTERLRFMLENAGISLILTQRMLAETLQLPSCVQAVYLGHDIWGRIVELPEHNPEVAVSSNNLAYIIYTSGSTGTAKGTMLPHRGVVNCLLWLQKSYALQETDRVMLKASLSFDASVWELFWPLLVGASVVIARADGHYDSRYLIDAIGRYQVTTIHFVPAMLRSFLQEEGLETLNTLTLVIVGGEALSVESIEQFYTRLKAKFHNFYGPTETSIGSTDWECERHKSIHIVPIGKPISNTQTYALDPFIGPVPIGVTGELHISGEGLARGYLKEPGITAEKFIANPFGATAGARLYRTGDKVRYLPDGNLEFFGRVDNQVKIRGYRIELGEIEARLSEQAEVNEVVVMARDEGEGSKRLVAYYTGQEVGAEALRSHLAITLPEYMLPAAYVHLEKMPLTPNGKLDYRALPGPEGEAYARRGHEEPQGEVETILAGIWSELLGVEKVGRWDNFFTLGGHSLLAVRALSRIQQTFEANVVVADLFSHPVLRDFAQIIERSSRIELPPIKAIERRDRAELSFAQRRLWFLAQIAGASQAYHISGGFRLLGELDVQVLRRALDQIVCRHEALRTTFSQIEGGPVQVIGLPDNGFHITEYDLSVSDDKESDLHRMAAEEARSPFDLEQGPLIRGRLARLGNDEHALIVTMHHIVSDGWSLGILGDEFSELYGAYREGREAKLPELPIQYADYASWQHQWLSVEVLEHQGEYWKKVLDSAPSLLELPTDRARPAVQGYAGASIEVRLDEELTERLRNLSRRQGTTLFMTLLTAWSALLSRLSGQQDVVIGTPIANRTRVEIEGLIGCFVNTLALRIGLEGKPTVSELLGRVRSRTLEAQRHQDIPFEQVVELVSPVRSLSYESIFQVMMSWQNTPEGSRELRGLRIIPLKVPRYTTAFDLSLSLREVDEGVVGVMEYASALFEVETIERWVGYWRRLLEGMVVNVDRRIGELDILGEVERRQLVEEWNDTSREYARDKCVHELIEWQAEKTPDRVAVVCDGEELSYGMLEERANRLGHYLRGMGVGPDVVVGLCLERSVDMVVALMGTLKAGGAYLPLDPEQPLERLSLMLEDAGAVMVLTERKLETRLPAFWGQVVCLDEEWGEIGDHRVRSGVNSENLAYVIYTSGSTGRPKGVMITHRGVVNYLSWGSSEYGVEEGSGSLAHTSIAFDLTVTSLYAPLLVGQKARIVREEEGIEGLSNTLKEGADYSLLKITPSHLKLLSEMLSEEEMSGRSRVMVIGGEALRWESLRKWRKSDPRTRLINEYGPTETVVGCSVYEVKPGEEQEGAVRIGRPIANTEMYILREEMEMTGTGVVGEIYIGGEGVARGYRGRPELSGERFLPNPYGRRGGGRLYRTGDQGRYLPGGEIEYLGRIDNQVKLRGYRIELGEIEARLAEHPSVGEAVVIAREDTPGDKRLVAYYTTAEQADGGVEAEALRAHLSAKLPEYMAPAAYVRLESLPLTPNGKLDRKGLPEPEGDAYVKRSYEAPEGEIENKLARIWRHHLKLDRIGRHDNFFELGGHSLLAVSMIADMRREGLQTDLRSVFASPTLHGFAETVGMGMSAEIEAPPNLIPLGCQTITPEMLPLADLKKEEIDSIVASVPGGAANIQDIYSLAPLQEGILFHHLTSPQGEAYVNSILLAFDTRERVDSFIEAFRIMIARHDVLRTSVKWENLSEPVQVVWREAHLKVEEVVFDPREGDIAHQLQSSFNPRRIRLDVSQAPMMRCIVTYDASEDRWLMLWIDNHLIFDLVAVNLILEEIQELLSGRTDRLPEPLPFRNFIAQVRLGSNRKQHEEFFRQMLGDVRETTAPFGLLDVLGDVANVEEWRMDLDLGLSQRLRERARVLGMSAASLCHLAWARVLSSVCDREDVVFGTLLFGRTQGGQGSERAIGLFINTLPVRIHVGDDGVEASARKAHALLAELMRHEHASLALAQRLSGVEAPAPLFSSLFNYRQIPRQITKSRESSEAWRGVRALRNEQRTNYPVTLKMDDYGDWFGLSAQTDKGVGSERICRYMETALEGLVEALEQNPQRRIRSIDVLPESERRQLLGEWNDTAREYPRNKCIHESFEEQVEKSPDAVALVYEERQLSYRELNARANQLAHHLRRSGVGPERRVAICLERSPEMVISLFAALKAGGACVPIDPSYPSERIDWILKDSEAAIFITNDGAALKITHVAPPSDGMTESETIRLSGRLHAGVDARNAAYVIYTSGSIGGSKGAVNEHYAVANRLLWMQENHQLNSYDVVLQKAPFGFDVSLWETFWPLMYGARLIMAKPDGHEDPDYLIRIIQRQKISVAHFAPSMLQSFLEYEGEHKNSNLRCVFCSGETLPKSLVENFRERLPETELFNLYGPTEAAADVTVWNCRERTTCSEVPIGAPVANTQIHILNTDYQLTPIGAVGELHIGGAQVCRGYINRAEITAERFLPDSFGQQPGGRVYRTGDLSRWLKGGEIEFLGRNDYQVKIRGHRIELGEIEARLSEYDDIESAVVIAREDGTGGKRLVAYYTGARVDAEQLRSHLASTLPEYMLPAAYGHLETMPLTPNGRLDRRALPELEDEAYTATTASAAPAGLLERATEELMVSLWEEILERPVGRDDNFFDLGGQSLAGLRLALRIKDVFGVTVDLKSLFDSPTVAGMASAVAAALFAYVPAPEDTPGASEPTEGLAPSFAQERIWFVHQLAEGGAQYNIPLALRLEGELDVDSLSRSLRYLVRRHSVLRSRFTTDRKGGLAVEISPSDEAPFEVRDLSHLTESDREHAVKTCINEEVRRGFHLDAPPLMRALLLRASSDEHYLAITIHHIACDGWSARVLIRELATAYTSFSRDQEPNLPELQAQYFDYARWQRQVFHGEFRDQQLAYWRRQLKDLDVLRLPSRPARPKYIGGRCGLMLGGELSAELHQIAREETVTLFMVLLAGWKLLLCGYTAQDDIAVGVQVFHRPKREFESLIGLFLNTLVLRTKLRFNGSFRQLLQDVRQTCLAAFTHQNVPFEELVQELSPTRDVAIHPLFQTMFDLQNAVDAPLNVAGLKISDVGAETATAKLDLDFQAIVGDDNVRLSLGYSSETFSEAEANRLLASFKDLLGRVISRPDDAIATLIVSPAQSPARNAAGARTRSTVIVPELGFAANFEAICARRHDRLAISTPDETLTYGELRRNSEQVARAVLEVCGAEDDRVAILAHPRSATMLACVVGTTLANKTYVPLDPSWPASRIGAILDDVGPAALVCDDNCQALSAQFADGVAPRLMYSEVLRRGAEDRLTTRTNPARLAYLLYTSGSTGVPKGVMQSERNLLLHMANYAGGLNLSCDDRMSLFPSYCYDAAIMDIFGALLSGASLHPIDPSVLSAEEIAETIRYEGLTILHMTPTVFRHVARAGDKAHFAAVRAVALGGEEAGADIMPLFRERFSDGCVLVNGLGPTECTLALQYYCDGQSEVAHKLPVGRPAPGISVALVDDDGQPGALRGEIVVGGEQIALGYWRRPELTAVAFRPDECGRRVYHTGDLGPLLPDGNVGYLGRRDSQVKIQGSRVELDEVEAALCKIEGIVNAAVAAVGDGAEKQLQAFFTASREISADEAKTRLEELLPRYMTPRIFVQVAEMPLMPNGKIDRQQLLRESTAKSSARAFKLPRTWLERALVGVWEEILQVHPISIDDDFFQIGGRSLLAPRLLSTVLRTLGCRLPLSALFETPTVERMAQMIAERKGIDPNSPLVPMQTKGACSPLFLAHPLSGEVLSYRHLVTALGPEQPCYGLQDPATASAEAPISSIEEMAALYCRMAQSVQPNGPWLLGGWSYGGVVAFEMARQLRAAGGEVRSLLLLDSYAPSPLHTADSPNDASTLSYIASVSFDIAVQPSELAGKAVEEQIASIVERAGTDDRQREFVSATLRRELEAIHVRRRSLQSYSPGIYEGPITLFYAADEPLVQERGIIRARDLGWSEFCTGPVEVVEIPGTHRDLAFPPHVSALANEIAMRLSAAADHTAGASAD